MRSSKSIMTGVAVLAALALPMVAGAANKLVVNGTDGTTPVMAVTDTGAIGSGTSTPSVAVQTVGATPATTQIMSQFTGTTTASGGGGIVAYHNNAAGALPNSGDRLGYILFGGYDGTTPRNAAGVTARTEGAWSSTSTPAFFSFETTPAGSLTRLERMRVTGDGNVGIGTTTPTQKLNIVGGIKFENATKPACSSAVRGTLWYTYLGAGLADTFEVCSKDAAGAYAWRALF